MAAAGIPVPDSEARWDLALGALKGVWASKYNDRAFYSLRKCGIDADDVRMAVCVMRVVPARYAFVIHTKNPQTNDSSEVGARLGLGRLQASCFGAQLSPGRGRHGCSRGLSPVQPPLGHRCQSSSCTQQPPQVNAPPHRPPPPGQIFAELVKGLGESLVSGMVPGSSIAFTARKDALDAPHVLSYASKSEGMFVRESLIFRWARRPRGRLGDAGVAATYRNAQARGRPHRSRPLLVPPRSLFDRRSDSNGEDLEGYAGAGLYESITMDPTEVVRVDYSDDPITVDPAFRNKVRRLAPPP